MGALITALAPALGWMIIGFSILGGVGSSLMIPPIYILVTVLAPDMRSRAKAFAVVSAMAGLGAALGPLLGGLITTTISWRASFGIEVLAVLGIIFLNRRLPDQPIVGERPHFDLLGAVLSAAGLVAIVLGVLLAGTYGWVTARKDVVVGDTVILEAGAVSPVLVFVGIGLVLLALFWWHIKRSARLGGQPLLAPSLFRDRHTTLGLITQNSQWFIMIGTFFVVSLFLQVSRGLSAIETGLVLTPATAGILLSSARAESQIKKYSPRGIIVGGFGIALAGIALLLLLADADSSVLRFLPGLLLLGFGAGSMLTASVNLVQSSVSEEEQGEVSGVSRSVSNLGSSLGTAVAGAVLVSVLISGITTLTNESTVLSVADQQLLIAAMEGDVGAVSDAQVRDLLDGRPEALVEEVTRINAEARNRALGAALLVVGVVGTIGLIAALLLPKEGAATDGTRV